MILSVGAESILLSACGPAESIILSVGGAESIILTAHAESIIFTLSHDITLTAVATKNTTIGNTDNC
jgi:hypothetical protein